MFRYAVFFGLAVLFFTSVVTGMCQGIPGCYPAPVPSMRPCEPPSPPPIRRSVRVDVPVPCAPVTCGAAMHCPPHPCAPPVCAPPPPTRPVQVRVDVVVRPENPKPCAPQRFCCENPPIFEPFFCQGAGLIQSLLAAPLALGERLMGHPVPAPLPAATPIPCWRMPPTTCAPCYRPPWAPQRMMTCAPPVRCAQQGPPVKRRPVCGQVSVGTPASYGPFPR
jgi:hypothetical protein